MPPCSSPAPASPEVIRDAVDAVQPMWQAAFALSAATGDQVETGLSRLQQSTSDTQKYLFWQSAVLILLTAMLVGVFTFLLMRPIRQIDLAISQLGKGTFSKAIAVRGPVRPGGPRAGSWNGCACDCLIWRGSAIDSRDICRMSWRRRPLASIREGTELLMDGAVGELDSAQREVTNDPAR